MTRPWKIPAEGLTEQAILNCLHDLETLADADGWDQPHTLWTVECRIVDLPDGATAITFAIRMITPIPLDVDRPSRVVDVLTNPQMLSTLLRDRNINPEHIAAWALSVETWMVARENPTMAEATELDRLSRTRKLHVQPDRIETRMIVAVDRAERNYTITRHRGDQAKARNSAVTNPGGEFTGDLPSSLLRLIQATP